jgi:hypothetical protein
MPGYYPAVCRLRRLPRGPPAPAAVTPQSSPVPCDDLQSLSASRPADAPVERQECDLGGRSQARRRERCGDVERAGPAQGVSARQVGSQEFVKGRRLPGLAQNPPGPMYALRPEPGSS